MTNYKVSAAITVWKTVTETQDIFFPTVGAIKHVDYTSQEVCIVTLQRVFESLLCETWLHHLSNCIPVGHGL